MIQSWLQQVLSPITEENDRSCLIQQCRIQCYIVLRFSENRSRLGLGVAVSCSDESQGLEWFQNKRAVLSFIRDLMFYGNAIKSILSIAQCGAVAPHKRRLASLEKRTVLSYPSVEWTILHISDPSLEEWQLHREISCSAGNSTIVSYPGVELAMIHLDVPAAQQPILHRVL